MYSSKLRRFVPWLLLLAVLLAVLILHRCSSKPQPVPQIPQSPATPAKVSSPSASAPVVDTTKAAEAAPPEKISKPKGMRPRLTLGAVTAPSSGPDTLPYVYATPWGGRHFDSVTVTLLCQENCKILYSLQDSVNLVPYVSPLKFQRNAALWFSGVSKHGNRTIPIRLDYIIEKKPNPCGAGMMPVQGGEVCMDVYEWPNREGALPLAMISQAQAADSCSSRGKHLCSLNEWQSACSGPQQSRYPYGENYDERYCPAQQSDPSRSGRFPACRSYYGIYDLTGNLWEWTSTVDPNHTDFYLVAGGNWEAAEKGTCSLAKYSFYPQNTYPAVGFRCCEEVK